jgi:hypothetical protein
MSYTKEIDEFNKKIDDSVDKIETLNSAQARYASDKFGNDITDVIKKMEGYRAEIENLKAAIKTAPILDINTDSLTEKLNQMQALYDDAEQHVLRLSEASDRASIRASKTAGMTMQQVIAQNALVDSTKSLIQQNALLANSITDGDQAAKDTAQLDEFEQKLNRLGIYGDVATDAVARFASELQQNRDLTLSKAVDDAKSKVEELTVKLKEGEQAAVRFKAQLDIKNSGWDENSNEAKEYIIYQQKIFALTQQIAEQNKKNSASASSGKRDANAAESVAHKLANLKQQSELAADSTRELSREQAILKAQQSLGKAATQDQIKQAGEYAAKTWDVANALKMRHEAEQATRFVNQEVSAAKVQRDPYTGEAVDPYAQVNEEESRKLEALRKYQKLGAVDAQQYEDGKTAIMQQAANERINIAQDESRRHVDVMNTLLGGLGDSFSGLADIISKSSGDTSDAYRVLFGIGKGFAVAQAGLNLQLALSNAMASGPFPWNLSAMASVAAAGGSLISSIAGATYGGARKNGGPVSAGEMYRVGEGGMPEIYQASSGKQYMIPGDNGKVISNKDMQGGGGEGNSIVQHINFEINTTGGIDDATKSWIVKSMKQVALFQINDQANRPNGMIQPRSKR